MSGPSAGQPGRPTSSAPTAPVTDWTGFDFDTRQVHAGAYVDRNAGLRIPPIALSAGYVFDSFDDQVDRFAGRALWRGGVGLTRGDVGLSGGADSLADAALSSADAALSGDNVALGGDAEWDPGEPAPIYSRQGNPTNAVAEARLASLEGGTAAVAVSSGQAAISSALFALAGQGDHIVSTASIYGGTRILFGRSFRRFGIDVDYVWDTADDEEWDRAILPTTKAIYTETIPNPRNDITDLRRIAAVAARHNLPLVVDNTVGTPALIRPFEHGAHIVVHSTTKFLTGHGAAVGGAIVDGGTFDWDAAERAGRTFPLITGSPRPGVGSLLERFGPVAYSRAVREAVVNDIGPALSPFTGFLLHQGMETLSLRMERHVDSSLRIAAWLEEQAEVESVDYAGLPSSPLHAIAERDYAGRTGSVFGVTVRGGISGARAFVDGLRVFSRMTGIGDTRSMVIHPLSSTHATFAPEITARLGITPGLLRLSVGLESADDLIRDLRAALDRV